MSVLPDDRRARLRRSIAREEAALHEALRDLRAAASPRRTIEERIARRPAPWLVGAFTIGLWLATGD